MRRAKRGKPRRRRARRARSGRARPRQFSELSSAALSRPTPRHRRPSQHHQRGQPPASPRRGNVPMEGATPAGGGKPSAAVFRQACLVEKRRARFWAASPTASPPSFAENPLEARSTHLRQDEHTLRPRPAPDGTSKGNFKDEQGTSKSGAGVGSPRSRRWGNATHHANAAKGNAAEPSLGRRAAHFNANAAAPRRGATHNSATKLGLFLAQAPRRG